jgi:hypothetical protein
MRYRFEQGSLDKYHKVTWNTLTNDIPCLHNFCSNLLESFLKKIKDLSKDMKDMKDLWKDMKDPGKI